MIEIAQDKATIQAEIRYLDEDQAQHPQAVQMYFDRYGLDWPDVEHRFGWFDSQGLKLAGHVWIPADQVYALHKSREMVIVLHGYLNHSGQLKHLILALLEYGYVVGSFDLPGHGLSEGKTAAVGAFSDYTQALLDFISIVKSRHCGPIHFIGFSTGATVGIDLLNLPGQEILDKIILAGPLVRWHNFTVSKALYALYCPFTDKIPRTYQKNSSDDNFLSFNQKEDYLHCPCVSLDWVRALYDWNDWITEMPVCNKKVLILQGNRDRTVDWRYNLGLLRGKFPAARIEMIKGARHELFNESMAYRQIAVEEVIRYLGQ